MQRASKLNLIDHDTKLLDRLCALDEDIIFFPVRHHSPLAARLVSRFIESHQPESVLIEGPEDYNPYLNELLLDHKLPVAIYSYFETTDDRHAGAWYPFCEFSPEWVAIRSAANRGADVQFIDLPWSRTANLDRSEDSADRSHRYADSMLRRGQYVGYLCEQLGVDDFDSLWDLLIESDDHLTLAEYMRRMHIYCMNLRMWDHPTTDHPEQGTAIASSDLARERFMASRIRQAMGQYKSVLVITGGYHSPALAARVLGIEYHAVGESIFLNDTDSIAREGETDKLSEIRHAGIALAPYSFDRLDSLTGYNAGMPNPGFYEQVWLSTNTTESKSIDTVDNSTDPQPSGLYRPLVQRIVKHLRKKKQIVSTADLVALETSARALAAMRGRQRIWRVDIIDAVTSTLVKDDLGYDCQSPFLDAVHAVLRGDRRGKLAEDARRPPLVDHIQDELHRCEIAVQRKRRDYRLDLLDADDVKRSRLLHRLEILGIRGFKREEGTNFLRGIGMEQPWECWSVRWTPEFETSCVEASRYGVTVEAAAANCLIEQAHDRSQGADQATKLLLSAAIAGLEHLCKRLLDRLFTICAAEPDFVAISRSLGYLLYLYRYDDLFAFSGNHDLAQLLSETFSRSLWLLESQGQSETDPQGNLEGLRNLLHTFQQAGRQILPAEDEFVEVLARVTADTHQSPTVRGATSGMLWALNRADNDTVLAEMRRFNKPENLGDYMTGLFCLAREIAQRLPVLVRMLDDLIMEFSPEDYLVALPALRFAMTFFTPREKHYLLDTLFSSLQNGDPNSENRVATGATSENGREYNRIEGDAPITKLAVNAQTAAEAMAWEQRLIEEARKYGIRDIV